jgi:hypothetical protein
LPPASAFTEEGRATMSHTTLRTGRGRTSPVRGSVIMMQCMVFVHQQTMVCHGRGDDDWQLARTEISASANSRLALSVALLRPLNTRRASGSSQRVLSVMQPSFCPARRPDDRVRSHVGALFLPMDYCVSGVSFPRAWLRVVIEPLAISTRTE